MSAEIRIHSVGTAVPPLSYSQDDLIELFEIKDRRIKALFNSTHIDKRHLYLPKEQLKDESQADLLQKHLKGSLEIGSEAINKALAVSGIKKEDISFLCVVSSTGFLVPGLSAYLIKDLPLRNECQRVDIVGMGCNAGLNGLSVVNNWSLANPDRYAVLLCVEICSAIYVNDQQLRTYVVNSLFGDGAAAVVVKNSQTKNGILRPKMIGFSSFIIPEAIDAMRFDWNEDSKKFSFFLHHANPYVVGKYIQQAVQNLLDKFHLKQSEINHWIVHGGGRNVISAVQINLGISAHDMRHTITVLRDFGNVSSASFLFSFERLLEEQVVSEGDNGVMITIGPGAQLETGLIRW
jgi:alkylresorcinol/alkylpyrone synthase/polyketide synthase Type III